MTSKGYTVDSKIIPSVVRSLHSNITNHTSQITAATILSNLSKARRELRTVIGNQGAIAPLIKFLGSSSKSVQECSLLALYYLSLVDSHRMEMINKGILDCLIHLLKVSQPTSGTVGKQPRVSQESQTDTRMRSTAWILQQLTIQDKCVQKIMTVFPVPDVVNYLSSTDEDVQEAMIILLYKYLRTDKDAISRSLLQTSCLQSLKRFIATPNNLKKNSLINHINAVIKMIDN